MAATEGPVAEAAPRFATRRSIRQCSRGFGRLSPSADSRSFGRRQAFMRVCISDAAALRMTFRVLRSRGRSGLATKSAMSLFLPLVRLHPGAGERGGGEVHANHAVAALALGLVERAVRGLDQRVGVHQVGADG